MLATWLDGVAPHLQVAGASPRLYWGREVEDSSGSGDCGGGGEKIKLTRAESNYTCPRPSRTWWRGGSRLEETRIVSEDIRSFWTFGGTEAASNIQWITHCI